jgi:transcriptional regulator with XRE-family HTH domain
MSLAKRFDLGEQIIHVQIYATDLSVASTLNDGFIRKLRRRGPYPISAEAMGTVSVDIELVRQVLRDATREGGPFTMRGLSKAAGLNRDAVYDIIAGRNVNPTVAVLASLAKAMESDLTIFGLEAATIVTSEAELRQAIREALPDMPANDQDEQAGYLSEVVGRLIGLPSPRQATVHRLPRRKKKADREEGDSPGPPTS